MMPTVSLIEALVQEMVQEGQTQSLVDVLITFAANREPPKSWKMNQQMVHGQLAKIIRRAKKQL